MLSHARKETFFYKSERIRGSFCVISTIYNVTIRDVTIKFEERIRKPINSWSLATSEQTSMYNILSS
jgi:hypothetical protein